MMGPKPKDFTPQELLIMSVLDEIGLRYAPQYTIGTRWADFFIAELNAVIEADGVYGHLRRADRKRDAEILAAGIEHVFHVDAKTRPRIKEQIWEFLNTLD
jgi:very-short-patch-repair endonuclease